MNALDVSKQTISSSSTAVSGHADGAVRLWDLRTGEKTAEIGGAHGGHVTSVSFSPVEGTQVLTNSRDGTMKIIGKEGS